MQILAGMHAHNFTVNDEDRVTDVEADHSNSSDQNSICEFVSTYFESIDFPEDTHQFLNDLYEQVKPSLQTIPLDQ